MSAPTIAQSIVGCAPGNALSIPCSGLTDGAGSLSLVSPTSLLTVVVPVKIVTTNGAQAINFTVPDGLQTAPATVTDSATNVVAVGLRVDSQYVQASEYVGEGFEEELCSLPAGQLDAILRRASAYADAYMGGTRRIMQYVERHRYSSSRRIYPYHQPIVSLDGLRYVTAQSLVTTFQAEDCYVNFSEQYIEILAFAVGQYILLGALETIGFSANVFELTLTAGYSYLNYPQRLREATIMIASDLLTQVFKRQMGLAGLKSIGGDKLVSDGKPFEISKPAKELLRPLIPRIIR